MHGLPLVFELSMLLADVLGEQFLIELASRWSADIDSYIRSNNECQQVKNDIHSLLKIQGIESDELADLMRLPCTHQILQTYSVGTEKSKINVPQTPSDNELVPLQKRIAGQ